MEISVIIVAISSALVFGSHIPETNVLPEINETAVANLSDPNKDVYVIHAMVYQVGILTNKTDNEENDTNVMGNQETVTFYHANGSDIDLGSIPAPLVTNVTAERMVGVAPVPEGAVDASGHASLPWNTLQNLASLHSPGGVSEPGTAVSENQRLSRDASEADFDQENDFEFDFPYLQRMYKRSVKSDNVEAVAPESQTPVKILSGSATIPQAAGVQSIAIPPLLTFNNNFSEIPVPIPNTSVVHYAKVNTLVHKP